jgi:hypothetical protein
MRMGISFPVRIGEKNVQIPWGQLEPHRAEIQKLHGKSLEYLAAHGGLKREDLVGIIGEKALPQPKGGKP